MQLRYFSGIGADRDLGGQNEIHQLRESPAQRLRLRRDRPGVAIPTCQAQEATRCFRFFLARSQEKVGLREIQGRQGARASRRFHYFGPWPKDAAETTIQVTDRHSIASRERQWFVSQQSNWLSNVWNQQSTTNDECRKLVATQMIYLLIHQILQDMNLSNRIITGFAREARFSFLF